MCVSTSHATMCSRIIHKGLIHLLLTALWAVSFVLGTLDYYVYHTNLTSGPAQVLTAVVMFVVILSYLIGMC